MQFSLQSAAETEAFGAKLFHALPEKCVVFLSGDLGAGKTTLVRGFMRAAGHTGTVKSPTYNIVEEYQLQQRLFFHFDLYRLVDPEELEWIGIADYLQEQSICFFEWPEKGAGYIGSPDVILSISTTEKGRLLEIEKIPAGIEIGDC
ncbi:tRNA threonylcarbamoyladenosine biosynthesis protein TsaE [Bathymodiolus japonicus methanotrophic gill symbiont]|uniref:tRNA (adenosine(37)-N6)-threonylcarbamoyltransferase complex ATPase subunit type 1 TsaE n=1 Tax=Bathymodiolus japonicus methanotrophic gill symbiont TaxID=113269 RepID=UPI001B473BDB|nr:tRNA (adenosine(37)-N6)-threonylcarbamoyltransferase complex ATPase subunit type 1 TsaE [Bathymodiolus japonicus methanotrophic gill symbiont]GFO72962.1 tRNA threonylcarbamoyladenosine biosynthesis protein TsaE [Bathymodiolus japonicus methanotrophic gill symbiont]